MVPDFEPGKNAKYPRNTLLCAPSPSHIYPLDSAKIDLTALAIIRTKTMGRRATIEITVLPNDNSTKVEPDT